MSDACPDCQQPNPEWRRFICRTCALELQICPHCYAGSAELHHQETGHWFTDGQLVARNSAAIDDVKRGRLGHDKNPSRQWRNEHLPWILMGYTRRFRLDAAGVPYQSIMVEDSLSIAAPAWAEWILCHINPDHWMIALRAAVGSSTPIQA